MAVIAETVLPDGTLARLEHDPYVPGAVQLTLNGTPQSHVHTARPEQLFFAYMQRIGHVIDALAPAREPITALHLGGGAYTLPRYIAATRTGSRQQIVEHSGELVDFVRQHLPLPSREPIRVRRGDARQVVQKLPQALQRAVQLIVVDCFSGAVTPAHLTSSEFYMLLKPLLTPNGIVAVNCADGAGGRFVRGQLATLRQVFGDVCAIGEPQVLKGRRFGNIILLAGAEPQRAGWEWLPRAVSGGPHPARLLQEPELSRFVAGAKPVTDQTAAPSPTPPAGLFA